MKSTITSFPRIIFHIVEDKVNPTNFLEVKFGFCFSEKIDLTKTFIINDKYFTKLKDKFKTNIFLTADNNKMKFIITLYYGENHISIFKSKNIGACFEIIQMFFNSFINPLNSIKFANGNNDEVSVIHYDSIENLYRRRFLAINFPINIKLNFNNFNKMEGNTNYKINLLPNDIVVQENLELPKLEKKEIKDLNEMKILNVEIDKIIEDKDINKIKDIENKLSPYDDYFNQDLMNKEEFNWNSDEFTGYYHYFKFKLFLLNSCGISSRKIEYYFKAIKIFSDIYEHLKLINDVSAYEKICAITSLYRKLRSDAENKENKKYLIGEYKLINMNSTKNKCYKLVYDFLIKIIDNLKEKSYIFLPILQANSGFSEDINFNDKKNIFEISMININMIKRHLKSLLPKLLFIIRHPIIEFKRGSTDKKTGNIFIYESSIFKNTINKSIDDIINNNPEDAAIMISFVMLHEIFMHKTIRSNPDFIPGRETPPKFIGPKLDIKNFYYSDNKNNLDPLSIYNKKKDNNKIAEDGESGKMLEYFFEDEKLEIISSLKKYLGFSELLKKVNLIVAENLDELHSLVKNKILKGEVQLLHKDKISKNKIREYIYDDSDEDEKERKTYEEDEEEEEEEEERELSEETKNILKSQTDCY